MYLGSDISHPTKSAVRDWPESWSFWWEFCLSFWDLRSFGKARKSAIHRAVFVKAKTLIFLVEF